MVSRPHGFTKKELKIPKYELKGVYNCTARAKMHTGRIRWLGICLLVF